MWRRLWLLGGLTFATGCGCGKPDGALKVVVDVDPAQQATCVVLEVSDGSAVLATQELERAQRNQWVVGLKQGALPDAVSLVVKGFVSASGCGAPRTFNGESGVASATFPATGVETVTLQLGVPPAALDADRDGYVPIAQGGGDCDDGDASIRPGAVELCTGSVDRDCDGAAACADTDCSATPACQRAPDRLAFVTPARTAAAGECSAVLTVEAQDAAGAAPAQQGLPVALSASPATGVTFYADASCTQAVTSVTIAQGQTRASLHFRSTRPGTTFTASAAVLGLTPASQVQTVTFPAPTQLAFSTPPRTVVAAACSQALSLELRDAGGAATQSAQAVPVALSGAPAAGLGFFLDAACTTPLSGGALAIAAGATGATFYARSTTAGAIALSAASTGLASAQQTLTVTAGAAAQIRFTSSAYGVAVNTCSSPVVLTTQDASGNASPVAADTVAALSANPGGNFTFYSDAACANAISQVTVAQGASSATLHFRGTAPAVVQVEAATSTLGNATQTHVVSPGPAVALAFTTAAQTVTAGSCSGVVTVQSRDAAGFPSNQSAPLVVALTAAPATPLQFFSDAACATAIAQATIATATASTSFYFRSTLAGAVQLTASSTLPTPAQQTETVTPAGAVAIAFLGSAQTVAAGACSAQLAVEVRDAFGNAVPMSSTTPVGLSSGPAGVSFFTDSGCATAAVTQVNVGVGQSTAAFYARSTLADAFTLTAQTAAQGSATQGFTATAGAATQLAFAPAAQTVAAGACSAAVQVQRRDAFNNPVSALGSLTVGLSSTAAGGLTFHSASDCNAPSAVASVDIPSNGSSAIFYVRATAAEVVTVTGAGGGLGDATHALTVTPAAAAALVLSPAAQTMQAGDCSAAVQVQRRDAFGNPTTSGLLTVGLASNATSGLTFHTSADCSGGSTATSVDLAAGVSAATFYARATVPEVVTVFGNGGGLTQATHALTVTPGPAASLTFAPAGQTVTAGVCSAAVTVTRRDQFSNLVTAGVLTVSLSSNATAGLTFHTAADCSGPSTATSVDITDGNSAATLYVRATVVEPVTVTGSGTGVSNAIHTLTINPAAGSVLVFAPAAQTVTAGVCSALVTVSRRDAFGNAVTSGATAVALGSNATSGLTFHSAADCNGGSAITGVTIADAASSATLYLRATRVEPVTVTGSSGGYSDATHALTINAGPAYRTTFTSAPVAVEVVACSTAITVQQQDEFGNPVAVGANTTVTLTDDGTGFDFHLAANCGDLATGSATIASGSSSTTFYVRGSSVGGVTMTATIAGLTVAGQQAATVTTQPADRLAFTTLARAITSGGCSDVVTVQRRDPLGNPVTSGGALTVNLSSTAASGLTYWTDAACTLSAGTSVQIGVGQSSASFYVSALVAEAVTLTAAGGGLTDATQGFTTSAGAATQLAFLSAPQSVAATTCSALTTVQLRDIGGNVVNAASPIVVTLSDQVGAPAITFFSDASCTTAVPSNQLNLGAGTSQVTFYFRGDVVGTSTISAAAPSLATANQLETITPAPPTQLVFTPATVTVEAGFCQALTLERRDAANQPTAPATPTTIATLTVSPVVGAPRLPFQFFSDNTCTTQLAAPFNINGGASSTVVYVKGRSGSLTGTTPGQQLYTVTATAAGLSPDGTSAVTVNPMVRRRSAACTIADTATSQICAITPALTDISRTMLLFQATPGGSEDNPSDDTVTCRLRLNGVSGNAEVFCDRYDNDGAVDIEWQTVSFPYSFANGGVTVQHVSGSCAAGAANAMPINVTVANAPRSESFVLMSHRSTGGTTDGNDFFISDLETATNLRFRQSAAGTGCNTDVTFTAQVVSWAGASVARAVSAGGAAADIDVSQSTPTSARTFLLYSSRMTGDTSGTAPNPDQICRRRLRGRVHDGSTLRFTRGCTGANVQDISWEHVLLPANTSVEGVQGTINNTANSSSVAITQVDMTRAFAFIGGQGPGGSASGQTNLNSADRLGSALVRTVFSSATQVNLNRITTSGTGSWHVWTVQVDP